MKFIQEFSVIIFVSICLGNCEEYRILGIFPNPEKDNSFSQALVKILVERGHHVDVISYFEMKNLSENYSRIFNLNEILNYLNLDLSSQFSHDSDFARDPTWFISQKYGNDLCNLMGLEKMQKLLGEMKENSRYDLILTETFGANCYIGLGYFLKVPVITITNNLRFPWIEESIGNPKSTAFAPNFLSGLSEINSFWDRLRNRLTVLFQKYRFYIYTQKQTEIMRKYLDPEMPDITEIEKNIALTLVNSHFSLNGIRPTTSAFIEVGGLHILENENKLTPKLQNWMDNANGVVYFDLGSSMTIEDLPKKIIYALCSSFAKIKPIAVLMRVKDVKKLPLQLPRNVKTFVWIPQIQILAHKNIKAYITPGGNLALQEALHFGVPIIGIPFLFDQFLNLESLVKKHVAIRIKFEDLSETKMNEALTIVLRVHIFREKAKNRSKLFRDRPLSARKTAIYWIEYIIRNGETSLKSPSLSLSWYQIELLDVYLFFLLSFLLVIYLFIFTIKKIFCKLHNYKFPEPIKEA